MKLYLVQHGKSLPKDVDPEKGLSREGIADVKVIAETAKNYNVHIERVWHSGKKRARQSAELFHTITGSDSGLEEKQGMSPNDDVAAFAKTLDSDNLMLVGHLPFMSRLASYLITGNHNIPVMSFQNGGIVCLAKDREHGSWTIQWTLMPNIG